MASVEQDFETPGEQEEKKHKKVQMSSCGVNMNAQTGGTVNAPILTGNTITSVIFNYNAAGTVTVTVFTETHCLLIISQ
ncbi:hypothetical protein QQF64_023521 [Cirrhinus molitorella]|uniref:Uncharacterized protein n=1 Tax=Cirrhinus molitorella TaxID=172907 RepID=A0ABR3L751_9TELE